MKKERAALESIMNSGYVPKSITELFDKTRVGAITNKNGVIYFLDIPDAVRRTLPSNAQRWCVRAASLDTAFNRWLWRVGTNAPDLDSTWKSGKTSRILWDLLVSAFGQEPKLPPDEPVVNDREPQEVYTPSCDDVKAAYRHRCRPGDKVDDEEVLNWVEEDLRAAGKRLVPEWRDIVRKHCL
jgi:hypothetical protein